MNGARATTWRCWKSGADPETDQAGQFRGTLAPSGNAPWRRCIVAEDVVDGVAIPVAAGVVHEASLHPERLWVYVEVARDHRRAGVGSTLLAMLRHEAEQVAVGRVPAPDARWSRAPPAPPSPRPPAWPRSSAPAWCVVSPGP